jgi:hypothetical protein
MATASPNKESDDMNSLNKRIEELNDELTNLVVKSNERGTVFNQTDNRRIETLQKKINGLKLKRQALLKNVYKSKILDIRTKKIFLLIIIHIPRDFY